MLSRFSVTSAFFLCLAFCTGCAKPREDGTIPFQGEWAFVGPDGKKTSKTAKFEKDMAQAYEVSDGSGMMSLKAVEFDRSSIQVDVTQTPRHIDFVILDGENQGKARQGIFVFEGDKLKICLAELEAPRPTSFVANDQSTLMILERK